MEPREVYPVPAEAPWAEEDGRIVVLLPKPLGPVSRAVQRATKGPAHLRVALDEVGSRAFLLADGTRTAAEVAEALVAELGDRAGPSDRALAFLAALARSGVLRLASAPTTVPPRMAAPRLLACPRCEHRFHVADPEGTRLQCPSCRRKFRA